ncbi:hypothetical protein BU15DRAFT_65063 [Melanogaster broomeanus]|nr:hypothetical protein BU15DRAFT_65063 [Melanogaster broomeanus]
MAEFPKLAADGHNWTTWRENIELNLNRLRLGKYYINEVMPNSYDAQAHGLAKRMIAITIHPSLLAHIRHLKSAHEYNIRTVADTRQKPSEGSCKVRDRETAVNKAESAVVEEPHDGAMERVETRGGEGNRAAGCMSEQGAAARGPGEGATDLKASGIGLAIMPSSQEDDTGVRCTPVMPQEPQMTSGRAGDASADAMNPRATSARPTEPAGASHNPQVELHEIAGSDNARAPASSPNDDPRQHAARGSGKGATDRTTDGTSTDETTNETTAPLSMPLEGERDSQATSGSMRAHSEGAEPPDGTADTQDGTQTQRYAKGTRTGQQHDASAHGEGRCARAEWPSSVHERNSCTMSGSTRVPEGIIEDLGGRAESSTSDRPPSAPLESHTGLSKTRADASSPARTQTDPEHALEGVSHQPSSGYTDDRTIAHEHQDESEVELEGGRMHTSAAPPNASATVVHSPANAPRGPFEGEQATPTREAPHSDATKTGGERNAPGGHRMGRINHDVNEATRRMIQAAAYSAKPGTGVMKTVSVSDPSSSKALSLADSDLYSSVSSGAHEESPESGDDSAFRATRSKDRPAADGHLMLTILVAELSIMTSGLSEAGLKPAIQSRIREFQPAHPHEHGANIFQALLKSLDDLLLVSSASTHPDTLDELIDAVAANGTRTDETGSLKLTGLLTGLDYVLMGPSRDKIEPPLMWIPGFSLDQGPARSLDQENFSRYYTFSIQRQAHRVPLWPHSSSDPVSYSKAPGLSLGGPSKRRKTISTPTSSDSEDELVGFDDPPSLESPQRPRTQPPTKNGSSEDDDSGNGPPAHPATPPGPPTPGRQRSSLPLTPPPPSPPLPSPTPTSPPPPQSPLPTHKRRKRVKPVHAPRPPYKAHSQKIIPGPFQAPTRSLDCFDRFATGFVHLLRSIPLLLV